MPTSTPWGPSQDAEHIVRGIVFYSTASHGGYHVSPKRFAEMHFALQGCASFGDGKGGAWFEEDCDWAAVVLAFPDHFRPAHVAAARDCLKNWHPDDYEAWTGEKVAPSESYVRRKQYEDKDWCRHLGVEYLGE